MIDPIEATSGPALTVLPECAPVLVVSDQLFDQKRIHRIIDSLGMETDIVDATSIETMTASLETQRFDLVVIDDSLRDGTALTALERLRASRKNRLGAALVILNDEQSGTGVEVLKQGCSDYVTHSDLCADTFAHACFNALQKSRLHKTLEAHGNGRRHMQSALEQLSGDNAKDIGPLVDLMMHRLQDTRQPGELSAEVHAQRRTDLEHARASLASLLDRAGTNKQDQKTARQT